MATNNAIDQLCGIERYSGSQLAGKLVVPLIQLWDSPYRRHPVAMAKHGEQVIVLERYEFEGAPFYHIEVEACEWVGRMRRFRGWLQRKTPAGWVSAAFLLKRGRPGRRA